MSKDSDKKDSATDASDVEDNAEAAGSSDEKKEVKKSRKKLTSLGQTQIHDQIIEALETLKERKGVSLVAIKRYLEENYKTDTQRQSSHIRKIIIAGVESGEIIRTRGTGAFGRFKVGTSTKKYTAKKRKAPEEYQELPAIKRRTTGKAKAAGGSAATTPKQKPTKPTGKAEESSASPKGPKGKKGRKGKK